MTRATNWLTFVGLTVLACPYVSNAADTVALAKRLHNAAEASSIDDPSLKPWHLKMNVQLYDAKGNPSEQGTIEEWRTSDASKRVYTTPSYTATEISTGKSLYRTKGQPPAPYLLDAALRFAVHPEAPVETIDKSHLKMKVETFGTTSLDCITMTQADYLPYPLPGQVPTSCLDPDMDQLRVSWYAPQVATRTRTALFQGRRVGVTGIISIYGVKAISQQVDELKEASFDSQMFVPSSDLEERSDDPVWVSTEAVANTAVRKIVPPMPPFIPNLQLPVTVMVAATIGKDGHIITADILASPNPKLSEAAVETIRQWVYRPYLVNGIAVKIKTALRIHYGPY